MTVDVATPDMLVDWHFIEMAEGFADKKGTMTAWPTKGFVPLGGSLPNYTGEGDPSKVVFASDNKSGVTIAAFFDLGAHRENDIRKLPTTMPGLIEKLVPFAGKKTMDACKELHGRGGLTITPSEAIEIGRAVKREKMATFVRTYDRAVINQGHTPRQMFANLPILIRTAVMSFALQYGENGNWVGPTASVYWKAMVKQDWPECLRILEKEYKTAYVGRRSSEARLYRKAGVRLLSELAPATRG